jgi:hypothetical protein
MACDCGSPLRGEPEVVLLREILAVLKAGVGVKPHWRVFCGDKGCSYSEEFWLQDQAITAAREHESAGNLDRLHGLTHVSVTLPIRYEL